MIYKAPRRCHLFAEKLGKIVGFWSALAIFFSLAYIILDRFLEVMPPFVFYIFALTLLYLIFTVAVMR